MSNQQLKPSKRVQDMQERCLELAEVTRERESAQVIQLPLWTEARRGCPNAFLRSALFAAVDDTNETPYLDNITLFSQKNYAIKFTGKRLNQGDLTVWLALVDLAHSTPLGVECSFTAYGILKHMGLGTGGRERERLGKSVRRLAACLVEVKTERFTYGGSLVDNFLIDEQTKHYKLTMNRELIKIFHDHEWTALSWEQRKKLRGKPLALALHGLWSSHDERCFPLTLKHLHEITGSGNKDKYGFKRDLKKALEKLIEIEVLEGYDESEFKQGRVTVTKPHKALPKPQMG